MFDPGAARPAFDGAMTQGLPPMQGGTLQSRGARGCKARGRAAIAGST